VILRRGVWALALAASLVACAGPSRQTTEAPAPAPAVPPPAARQAAPPAAPEPPRQADSLARISSELVELQNAVAKLMMSSRQHDDQLLYLQRRLTELENQARGRGAAAPLPPSASMPSPLPPAPLGVGPMPPAPNSPSMTPANPSPAPRTPPSPALAPPTSPAEELYRAGLEKYQAGDLDGAVVTLYEVVANFPADPAREASQFLVGEIFIAQKDYRGAIAELEGLISAMPRGTRVPDALLKIGLAHRSLGEEVRARRAWERLVKDYPSSAPARQARTLLKGRS
jgi:TolA-binding protein